MDSLPNAASCRHLCPVDRFEKDKDRKVITDLTVGGKIFHVISSPHCISDAVDENSHQLRFLRDGEEGVRCYSCLRKILEKANYYCSHHRRNYHKECVESPSLFQSSDHPKHPLQLVWFPGFYNDEALYCISCTQYGLDQFYACLICDFIIHPFCAINPTSLTIDNPKRHEHTVHYIRRKSNMVCDVCGLKKQTDYLYACLQCDFIVHKQCVYSPEVIQVLRHIHRLTFTPSIPYKEWTNCGVCQTKINGDYGKYSCIKGCAYAMHIKCALRSDVCDGRELEGEPEEAYENTKMFELEGDGIIRHSIHPNHQMRFDKMIESVYDENKYCQLCILPFVDDGKVYRCLKCEFILHESCAYLPRKKQFMLHDHPLILKTQSVTWFRCKKCDRYSCGYKYVCVKGCDLWKLDTLCASICEPFDYHSHPHSLFITCDRYTYKICSICREGKQQPLSCDKCKFVLCFKCATLPHKVRYEHDEHLLTFSYKEEANNEVYCCQICEEDIDPKQNGFYACNECGLAIHIECLLGRDPYLKPGQNFILLGRKIRILANTWSTRPVCRKCKRRCPYKIKLESVYSRAIFCSWDCFYDYI